MRETEHVFDADTAVNVVRAITLFVKCCLERLKLRVLAELLRAPLVYKTVVEKSKHGHLLSEDACRVENARAK